MPLDAARDKAVIMAYINSLPEKERVALENGFVEHLAGAVPAIVSKRFTGGETWCADPIIRTQAAIYLAAQVSID